MPHDIMEKCDVAFRLAPDFEKKMTLAKLKESSSRDAYGETLKELILGNPDVVALSADLAESTRILKAAEADPKRFFNFGVAEQNMLGAAAGLALSGKIPFVSSFAIFATGRAWEQIRNVIAHDNLNVKIVASHSGLSVCADGSSHQALEDIAIMRTLPNMRVVVPADAAETRHTIRAIAKETGPVYVRLSRPKSPVIYENDYDFKIGRAVTLREGTDVTLAACGLMVYEAMEAAKLLAESGINARVLNVHTIKPMDAHALEKAAADTGAVVTIEEHSIIGGLGSAVAESLAEARPVPVKRVGTCDCFGQSGDYRELLKEYSITIGTVVKAVKWVVSRRR